MNLGSPLFDIVRIPPRRTPDSIAIEICAEAGLDLEEVRSLDLPSRGPKSSVIRRARIRIACRMRARGFPFRSIAAWFVGIHPRTVSGYLSEGAAAGAEAE